MRLSQSLQQAISSIAVLNPEALITLFNDMGYIAYASDNHETELGFKPRELIGVHWTERVHPDAHQQAHLWRVQIEFSDRDTHIQGTRILTKDGGSRQVKSAWVRKLQDQNGSKFILSWLELEPN